MTLGLVIPKKSTSSNRKVGKKNRQTINNLETSAEIIYDIQTFTTMERSFIYLMTFYYFLLVHADNSLIYFIFVHFIFKTEFVSLVFSFEKPILL